MTKMLQSWIGRAMFTTVAVMVAAATPSRAARAARSASRLAVFAIVATAAVFAAIALTSDDADAQAAGQVKSLSVGGDHACALTETDEILCWGRNDAGQTNAPTSHKFASLSLGKDYSCGLNWRGRITATDWPSVSCWGAPQTFGYISEESVALSAFGESWASPENVGITHACGYSTSKGEYTCAGSNKWGQLDTTRRFRNNSEAVIKVGGWHTCRYISHLDRLDLIAQCNGRNDSGQNDVPYFIDALDTGREHTCVIVNWSLKCWGKNDLGQSSPPAGSNYKEVSSNAFANFNCALTRAKKVVCWGDNSYGQLNVPATIAAPPPLLFITQPNWITHNVIAVINSRVNQMIDPIVMPLAQGGGGPISYAFIHRRGSAFVSARSVWGLPPGLVFDETTRVLSGQLRDGGYTSIIYRAATPNDQPESAAIGISVFANSAVPKIFTAAVGEPELGVLNQGITRRGVLGSREYYTFRLTSPTQLTVDLESVNDTVMTLWKESLAANPTDFDRYSEPLVNKQPHIDVNLQPASYWLIVDRAGNSEGGAYTLRISSPDFTGEGSGASQDSTGEGSLDSAGRIVARRLQDGRTEFAWQPEGGDRILPRSRYLPANPPTGRWLNSSDIVVEGVNIGRINVRVGSDTETIEFAFTPTGRDRILPQSRYFPEDAHPEVWLRSTLIEPGG